MKKIALGLGGTLLAVTALAQGGFPPANSLFVGQSGALPAAWRVLTGACTINASGVLSCSGVWRNKRNAQAGSYTAVASDCGKTIALTFAGTGPIVTLTLTAPSNYTSTDPECVIVVKNESTSRAPALAVSGISELQPFLWPLQTKTFFISNGVWQVDRPRERWKKFGPGPQFHVDTNQPGSDSNDCLGVSNGACLTIANTLYHACIDWDGEAATINLADSPNAYPGPALSFDCLGANQIIVRGNKVSPGNVKLSNAGAGAIIDCQDKCILVVEGVQLVDASPGITGAHCRQAGSVIDLDTIIWGVGWHASSVLVSTDKNCTVNITGNNQVSSGVNVGFQSSYPGGIINASGNFQFNGPLTFNIMVAVSTLAVFTAGGTWTATGVITTTTNTCSAVMNGVIQKFGSTIFGTQPCDQATSAGTGGQVQ